MPFLTAFMLWGALAAAIPVAIHLFFRSRYRTVPWAAMKFLLTSVEQTSRRLKFQEYVLLLIRVAVLVFLALALARPINLSGFGALYLIAGVLLAIVAATWALAPFWKLTSARAVNLIIYGVTQVGLLVLCVVLGFGFDLLGGATTGVKSRGESDSVDAVLVFDTSYSMGAQDGAKTRLVWAKEEAVKIIDELPPHSTAQIITCAGKTPTLVGPRAPANLDQAKKLVQELDIVHLATDLAIGVAEAKKVLSVGTASNKELYVFSDMQKMGFKQNEGVLKANLDDIREKAIVHFVRCGTRTLKNVAIIGITPQTGNPRPGEKAGFGVLIQNTSSESIENLNVSLLVDGEPSDERKVPKLGPTQTHAVTLRAELKNAGPRVLTAKVVHDDLDGDNRYDHVVMVRKQVNILVVDGKPNDKEPLKASSFFAAHALALARHNPHVVPARLASPLSLKDKDICILVNCALKTKLGVDALPSAFVEALGPFVREGHGLMIFSGDNVEPAAYNAAFLKDKLLPMPLKPVIKAIDAKLPDKETEKKPFKVDRQSFRNGPPAFWIFQDDERYYKEFDKVEVWQHIELNEPLAAELAAKDAKIVEAARKELAKDADQAKLAEFDKKAAEDMDRPFNVILRINNGQPLVVSKKVGAGEVIFVATAAHDEGLDAKGNPHWTDLGTAPEFIPFMDVTVNYLLQNQAQTYNLIAGQSLNWYPTDKHDHAYYLVHPDGKRIDRLGIPDKDKEGRLSVTATDLPRAGVYRMTTLPRGSESTAAIDPAEAAKTGVPIAVIPDLTESADLTTLTAAQIDTQLGFPPIHIVAGQPAGAGSAADRLNREWTTWALLLVMALVLIEVAFAWWCGRGW